METADIIALMDNAVISESPLDLDAPKALLLLKCSAGTFSLQTNCHIWRDTEDIIFPRKLPQVDHIKFSDP